VNEENFFNDFLVNFDFVEREIVDHLLPDAIHQEVQLDFVEENFDFFLE
jgi:hypothetical protein